MKLAFSNIAWSAENDEAVYAELQRLGFAGLEIAPTRLFGAEPYTHLTEAADFARRLYECRGLRVCSMQSIWYGRKEQIFGSEEDRQALVSYTARAVDFAAAMDCKNLVFGCPANRSVPKDVSPKAGEAFFRTIAGIAAAAGVTVALEANPVCYGTNFLNTTRQALDYCKALSAPGLGVNLDLGACIYNGEELPSATEDWKQISHVHISRPGLAPVAPMPIDRQLKGLPFTGYCSVEMKNPGELTAVLQTAAYIREVLS